MAKSKEEMIDETLSGDPSVDNSKYFYIVGIGASAGGLEALEKFFSNCPGDTGMAFVVIQHLSPDYKSMLTELLGRRTIIPVTEAKDRELIKPNHIYLIPVSKNIQVQHGRLHLINRPDNNSPNFSIDLFFRSLAIEQKEMAIAVILSGTGSDGTRGGKSIKEVGGTVFVQHPESGRFDGMPRSAISSGIADCILTPEEMPNELIQFTNHPHFAKTMMTGVELGKDIESIDRILKILKSHTSYDFFSYKKATLLRRTAKRMNITKCKTVEAYIDYLYENSEEKYTLVNEFLIGVTKFFRDPAAFAILEETVIPQVVKLIEENKNTEDYLKIWVVACSTGEEAYSIAILIEEYLSSKGIKMKYKIFATDIDRKSLDVATRGLYLENIINDITKDRISKYFIKQGGYFKILPKIRKNIIFSKHDILKDPPFNRMSLISCRNMMIYIENDVQKRILINLHGALKMNGFLFLGNSESLGSLSEHFNKISNKWKIYENTSQVRIRSKATSRPYRMESPTIYTSTSDRLLPSFEKKVNKLVNKTLLNELNAVSICINKNFDIIQASGRLKKYVIIPEDGFSYNLQKLLPDELSIPIATGIRFLSKNNNEEKIIKKVKMVREEVLIELRVVINEIKLGMIAEASYLITIFEEVTRELTEDELTISQPASKDQMHEMQELREALEETRDNLQVTVEELETSNEEMQATNEELLSSNEELQSTNEELQSLNEELHTVNSELQDKNLELIELNTDIENLMSNINIGTIFLDKEMRIRRYTPAIQEQLALQNTDIGRPIQNFAVSFGDIDLVKESTVVLKTRETFRAEFKNLDNNWFLLQIHPYLSHKKTIKGVVINFIDINELKEAHHEKIKLDSFVSHITASSPVLIYVYDMETRSNVYSSGSIFDISGYTTEEVQEKGESILSEMIHPDDFPGIIKHHEDIMLLEDEELSYVEYRLIHSKTKKHIWMRSVDKVNERDANGKVKNILGVAQDVTRFKAMELEVATSEKRARLAIQGAGGGLWEWTNTKEDYVWLSKEFCNLLGYTQSTLDPSAKNVIELVHPDFRSFYKKSINQYFRQRKPFEVKIKVKHKTEGYRWYRITMQAEWDDQGWAHKAVGMLFDEHEQEYIRQLIEEKQERLEAIYDSAPVGILLASDSGHIVESSKGIADILGYEPNEIVGKHFLEFTYEEDKEISKDVAKSLTANRDIGIIELDKRYVAKDKSVVWIQVRIGNIKVGGEPFSICILSDINERKKSEQKLKILNEELERFAYLASHDLKEPLQTISGITERFKEKHGEQLPSGAIKYIDFIEEASNRMRNLTNELLTYSKLGHSVRNLVTVDLNKLLEQVKKDMEGNIQEHKVSIVSDKLPKIKGDDTQLGLLFQNLISNSIKYRKKTKPKITIKVVDKGEFWEFTFKDNGIGIDEKYHKKIFDVFKRLHNKSEYEGTGIGLSNCKRIVSNHGGEIWVKSKLTKGATFFFTIPKKMRD